MKQYTISTLHRTLASVLLFSKLLTSCGGAEMIAPASTTPQTQQHMELSDDNPIPESSMGSPAPLATPDEQEYASDDSSQSFTPPTYTARRGDRILLKKKGKEIYAEVKAKAPTGFISPLYTLPVVFQKDFFPEDLTPYSYVDVVFPRHANGNKGYVFCADHRGLLGGVAEGSHHRIPSPTKTRERIMKEMRAERRKEEKNKKESKSSGSGPSRTAPTSRPRRDRSPKSPKNRNRSLSPRSVVKDLTHWDKDAVLAFLEEDGLLLRYMKFSLRDNDTIVCAAMRQNPEAIKYASERVQEMIRDPEGFLLKCTQEYFDCLKAGHDRARSELLDSVRQNGLALGKSKKPSLKRDKEIVLCAVRQNGLALQYTVMTGLNDYDEIVQAAVNQNRSSLQYASERLQTVYKVYDYLSSHKNGEANKEEGKNLLTCLEDIKKKLKKHYRDIIVSNILRDANYEFKSPPEWIAETMALSCKLSKNLNQLRDLRKQLKDACKFTKEDLDSCKVLLKETTDGYHTDSSCQEDIATYQEDKENAKFHLRHLKEIEGKLQEAKHREELKRLAKLKEILIRNTNFTREELKELGIVVETNTSNPSASSSQPTGSGSGTKQSSANAYSSQPASSGSGTQQSSASASSSQPTGSGSGTKQSSTNASSSSKPPENNKTPEKQAVGSKSETEKITQEVNAYLENHSKGAASKAEGGDLLTRTEALKKETKKSYRTIDSLIDDEVPTSAAVLREQLAQHQKDLNQLRGIRKQLKEACKFSKEELESCKVRLKPNEGDAGMQTDSSDEDNMSREDVGFGKGTIKGIAEGIIAAFENSGQGMKGLCEMITNPLATKESLVEFIENIPELPGLFCAYLEELSEADEEKRAEEIAKFITEQVILLKYPEYLPVNLLGKVAKVQLGIAAMKLAENGIKLTGGGKKAIGNLIQYKDKTVREVLKIRGGNASAFREMRTDYIDKALGEIGNLEAIGDQDAKTIMKLVKKASIYAQKH